MTGLTTDQLDHYKDKGYISPVNALNSSEAKDIRNEIILMMKGTSLASTVTLMDLTGVAKYIISTTFKPIEVFIVAGGIYLLSLIHI